MGLREVRYGLDGANHLDGATDDSNPYFTFDPTASASSARAACAPASEVQGTFALTIDGRGFDSRVSASADEIVPRLRVRLVRRVRAGLPDRHAAGEDASSSSACRPAR